MAAAKLFETIWLDWLILKEQSLHFCRGQRDHDSRRCDRILCSFLRLELSQLSPDLGGISLQALKKMKTPLEDKWKDIQWRRHPDIADSVPCHGRMDASQQMSRRGWPEEGNGNKKDRQYQNKLSLGPVGLHNYTGTPISDIKQLPENSCCNSRWILHPQSLQNRKIF